MQSLTAFFLGRDAAFVLTLIFGAFATVRHRMLTGLAVALAVAALSADLVGELAPQYGCLQLEAALKLARLSILVFMTVRIALRTGRVDLYRVIALSSIDRRMQFIL
jgi:hypothetical protein